MDRGGEWRSEHAKSKGPHGPIERKHATSPERTAGLVGYGAGTVKRARRIRGVAGQGEKEFQTVGSSKSLSAL